MMRTDSSFQRVFVGTFDWGKKVVIYKSKFGDVYYEITGAEGKPTVVFCHGVGMDHRTFQGQVTALQEDYRVVLWDMPGHGRSTNTEYNMRFSLMAAECLAGLLEETGIQHAVLVGLSLGSFVVQQFLCKYPEKVVATVHIGGASLYPKYSVLLKPVFLFMGIFKIMPAKMFYRSFARHRANNLGTRQYLEEAISITGKNLVLKITRDLGEDFTEGLPEPPARPMLITYGEDDIFTRGLSAKWHRRTPGSRYAIIGNANHIANQDNKEEFNRVLISFLEEL